METTSQQPDGQCYGGVSSGLDSIEIIAATSVVGAVYTKVRDFGIERRPSKAPRLELPRQQAKGGRRWPGSTTLTTSKGLTLTSSRIFSNTASTQRIGYSASGRSRKAFIWSSRPLFEAVLVIHSVTLEGKREILVVEPMYDESEATWAAMFEGLKSRGLHSDRGQKARFWGPAGGAARFV
jgi:hypothetical protein